MTEHAADPYQQEMVYMMTCALVGEGPLRERLKSMAMYMTPRVLSNCPDKPTIKKRMLEILDRLSHVEAGPDDDGKIDATVKRLSDQEANKIAEDVVTLFLDALGGWKFV